jgi:hypothetical protein
MRWSARKREGEVTADGASREASAPSATDPSAGTVPEWAPRAIVVVHGIGRQKRGATRESLARAFHASGAQVGKLIFKPGRDESPRPSARPVTRGSVRADLYEVYWAPLTANKTTARSVSAWLLTSTFLPGDAIRWPSRKAWLDLVQFFGYLAVGLLIVLLALNMLGNLAHEASCSLGPRTERVFGGERGCGPTRTTLETVASGGVWDRFEETFGALGRAWSFRDRPLQDLTPSNAADILQQLSVLTWLALFAIAWATAQFMHRLAQILLGPRRGAQLVALLVMTLLLVVLMQSVRGLFVALIWVITVVAVTIRATTRFLSEDLGDIEVYVNQDENKKFFEARQNVIRQTEHVFRTVDERNYKEVIVFGHSLGSVVAFDVLVDGDLPEGFLDRVKGFVTFGSAWEKVRYFFDRKSGDPERGERRRFVNRALNKIETNMWWLNVWNTTDWVANPISTYRKEPPVNVTLRNVDAQLPWVWNNLKSRVVNLHRLSLWPFPRSHSRYLLDRKVRQLFSEVAFAGDLANLDR